MALQPIAQRHVGYTIHERLPDVNVCASVAGHSWQTKCTQTKTVYRNVKRIEPHIHDL